MTIELANDPKVSLIVPVYKVPPNVFKRCLLSLEDQNYKNMEVIIVFDGVDQDLIKVATPFLKDNRFKIKEIEHSGACGARNAGFNLSTGEIVSFFNSDYVAKPGMVRLWVDELVNHPDCGFAYGGYDWASSNSSCFASFPFDGWQLKIENYIDCGFPLWRKYVVEWDPQVKSLQDWDFWLRVVYQKRNNNFGEPLGDEVKVKGFFMELERTFVAELPRAKGLSEDSSHNWVERVKYIKDKNGISQPEILVNSFGAPFHGKKIAQMIGADFRQGTWWKPNEYKALYQIGWYMTPKDQPGGNDHPRITQHFKGRTRILHFVGADIYWLKKFPFESLKYITGALNLEFDYILSENEQAQAELREMGIHSDICPLPPYNDYELKPLPKDFKVSIFLTGHSDFDKYCKEETLSIVRAMPDVQFTAYGDAAKELEYPNLKCFGNMDSKAWKEYVYDNSCYLRIVRHDTRPMASDEFILAGRDVVTNIPAEYMTVINTGGKVENNEWDIFQTGLNETYWPTTKKKIIQAIRKLRDIPASQEYRVLARGKYEWDLDREKYIQRINQLANTPRIGLQQPVKELALA